MADKTAMMGKFSFDYVSLGNIIDVVMPMLNKHGLMLTQPLHGEGGAVGVETRITYTDGTSMSSGILWRQMEGSIHDVGKTVTTMRRIQLKSLLGLAETEEEDEHETAPANQGQRQSAQSHAAANTTTAPCPVCHAPAGKPHATGCSAANSSANRAAPVPTQPVAQGDVDFGMDRGPSPLDPEMSFYVGLMDNPFYQEELQAGGVGKERLGVYRKWDAGDKNRMNTQVAAGKKISQYGYLASLMDKICSDKEGHTIVLSYLLGRKVDHINPPPYGMKSILDDLMSADDEISRHAADGILTIYETCKALWEEQKEKA